MIIWLVQTNFIAAAPRTFLNVDKFGATATTNEVANSAVVFLYQD